MSDYRAADPQTMVARQLSLIDWAQRQLANEQEQLSEGYVLSDDHVEKLLKVAGSLDRAVSSLARSSKLTEELAARMSPRQLLDAAIEKLEAQDEPTITYCVRRLRAARAKLTTKQFADAEAADTAVGALASLGLDLETMPQGAFPEETE